MKKDNNKKNILWFSATSMKNLYKKMENWQKENEKRFLSFSIEKEDSNYACIALTNPSEVVIVSDGRYYKNKAGVKDGKLQIG